MAISSLVAAESSTVNAKVFQIAAAYTTYEINDTFAAGGYTVTTSPATSQVNFQFLDASSILIDSSTTNGTVSFSIASDATALYLRDISGSTNTTVTITYTSQNVSGAALSGTLDTITTTSTYNQTGFLYVMPIGGGGGGGGGTSQGWAGGGGGGGGQGAKFLFTNASQSITIGTGGNGGLGATSVADAGTTAGATSFGNLITSNGGGGGGGGSANSANNGSSGAGGTSNVTNSRANGGGPNTATGQANLAYTSITAGTNGGGGSRGVGAGSGIGTGGTGNNDGNGGNASGYGAGGGGAGNSGTGGVGTSGVVYVLRGF